MIKLGTMSLNVRGTTATEFAQIVSDLNLDQIELHSTAFESTNTDYLRILKMDLQKKGLPLGYIGVSNNFGVPIDQHPDQIAKIKNWIDIASFMSCPLVRVFAAYVPEDCTDEEELWPPMIRGFKEVAEYGYQKGIIVGLQNHNHNNVPRTGDNLLRALNETNHPYFTHIVDTGQYAAHREPVVATAKLLLNLTVMTVLPRRRPMLYMFVRNSITSILVLRSG